MSREAVLVDADWVEAHLSDPNIVLVEVDEDVSAYDKGHISGAVRIDWKADLQDPVRRDFVDKAGFEKLLSSRGIGNDDTVILYGGNNNWFAAYAYWYFKLYGHENIKLLDGGRKKWELDSRELTTDTVDRPATNYTAKDVDTSIRAFRDDALAAIGKLNLVDVRSPDEFSGKLLAPAHLPQEQSQRGGHIPTAKNIPWSKAANDDGTFRSDDELRDALRRRGRRFRQGHHRVLPHRRALGAHVVCAARDPRPAEREELRRVLDRVRLARRRADRARGWCLMCGAVAGGLPAGVNAGKEAVIQGVVRRGGEPVVGYVRLLDGGGEFTAEVPTSATGEFRFFAAPGTWTVRALVPGGTADRTVDAAIGEVAEADVSVG